MFHHRKIGWIKEIWLVPNGLEKFFLSVKIKRNFQVKYRIRRIHWIPWCTLKVRVSCKSFPPDTDNPIRDRSNKMCRVWPSCWSWCVLDALCWEHSDFSALQKIVHRVDHRVTWRREKIMSRCKSVDSNAWRMKKQSTIVNYLQFWWNDDQNVA